MKLDFKSQHGKWMIDNLSRLLLLSYPLKSRLDSSTCFPNAFFFLSSWGDPLGWPRVTGGLKSSLKSQCRACGCVFLVLGVTFSGRSTWNLLNLLGSAKQSVLVLGTAMETDRKGRGVLPRTSSLLSVAVGQTGEKGSTLN